MEPWDCTVVTKDMHWVSHSTDCIHFNKRQNVERSLFFICVWTFVDSLRQLLVGHSSNLTFLPMSGLKLNALHLLDYVFGVNIISVLNGASLFLANLANT